MTDLISELRQPEPRARDMIFRDYTDGHTEGPFDPLKLEAADHIETLETALRTIQSAVPKYLKKEMTAEEFALVVIGEADSDKVNKALEGKK